ncbi:MAG TPA: FAD-dependent oxidoreductase [Chthonomonadaceae bacterium]|nr:FAD-dependent oxidoreductase [Chthonomonadaceae bacterium]
MPYPQFDYDIIILGGGSAGIVAGVMAGGLGMRVLLIEKEKMGGECLNTGCVPSKALLHAASVVHALRTAASVGLKSCAVSREEAAGALAYARETIARVRDADATEQLLGKYGVTIRFGNASFQDAHTLMLEEQAIRAANFLLATGSSPAQPDIPGLKEVGYHTNQTIFDLETVPETLLVVGGGPVGVEMAQAFHRLGSQVILIQRADRLLPRDDSELTMALEAMLRAEGMDIRLQTTLTAVRWENGRRVATLMQDGNASEVVCEEILLGVGRVPNLEGLNLAAAGVAFDPQGIPVDSRLRTSAPNIYACGDVLGKYQFSHMAEYEAKIAVRNIVFPGASRTSFRIDPWTTFTEPELAHVGLTEDEARAQGIVYDVCRQSFAQDDRALTEDAGKGMVKVLTQGWSGKILGAHILGPRAGELIQEWTLAMEQGLSIRAIADLIHVYPTLSMASQHAAQRWYEQKAEQPLVRTVLQAYVNVVRPRQTALVLGLIGGGLLGIGVGLARKFTRQRSGQLNHPLR